MADVLQTLNPFAGLPRQLAQKFTKLGGISRYISEQCETPYAAILQSLPGSAARPYIGLLTFGLSDVLRGYFRPRRLRGARKLRRRQRWYNRPTMPELGEEIGKRITGADTVKGRSFGTLEKFGWLADGVIQRGLYYVMVFGAVQDTWYNSILALRKQGFCATIANTYLWGSGSQYRYNNQPLPWLTPIAMGSIFRNRGCTFTGPGTWSFTSAKQANVLCKFLIYNNAGIESEGFVTIDGQLANGSWRVLAGERFKTKAGPPLLTSDAPTVQASGRYKNWRAAAVLTVFKGAVGPGTVAEFRFNEMLVMNPAA